MQMDAEERKIMREREKLRRQRLEQEAEKAFRESGLRLDPEKRAAFEARYVQERAKLEHNMHQELEAKRQKETSALVDRLKKEFQSDEPKATASSTVSPKPGDETSR
jgi:Zn-dependent oligopeptidase